MTIIIFPKMKNVNNTLFITKYYHDYNIIKNCAKLFLSD